MKEKFAEYLVEKISLIIVNYCNKKYLGIIGLTLYSVFIILSTCIVKLIKSGWPNIITFYRTKRKIKNIQNIIIYNYNVETLKEMLLDMIYVGLKVVGILIYIISYFAICLILDKIMDNDYINNKYFLIAVILILIFILPLFAKINFKNFGEKIVSIVLIEDIYILFLIWGINIKNLMYIFLILISLIPFGLMLLFEFKFSTGREFKNSLIVKIKKIRLAIIFAAGVMAWEFYNIYVILMCTAVVMIGIETLLGYYLDIRKHFIIKIKKDNGEILETKESVVMCKDGRIGIISKDGAIIFIERNKIENIMYSMQYDYILNNKKIWVTDSKGKKEFDNYRWKNKEWLLCRKKSSIEGRKYDVYIYDVRKIDQIELL